MSLPPSILLIEQDNLERNIYARSLHLSGFMVLGFACAESALGYLRETEHKPKVIVADGEDPEMGAASFLQHLRSFDQATPAIFYVDPANMAIHDEALGEGDELVSKPLNLPDLARLIGRLIG